MNKIRKIGIIIRRNYRELLFVFLAFALMVLAAYFSIEYILRGHLFDRPDLSVVYTILIFSGVFLALALSVILLRFSAAKMRSDDENKLKSSFLAKMSHEIRTPMNTIAGTAELLLRTELPDTARSYVLDIKHAGSNLISLINDILDFSKIEAGSMEIIPEKYSLSSVTDSNFETEDTNLFRFTLKNTHILVVDDLYSNLAVAKGLLEPYQATVDICLSGERTVELVKQKYYDIVFLDHMMPDMDGIEVAAAIREWEKAQEVYGQVDLGRIPIVALTANAVAGMREMFLEKGFDDFIAKPIDVVKLDEVIDRWISKNKKEYGINTYTKKVLHSIVPQIVIPGFDVQLGITHTGGTEAGYYKVLSLFCKDAQERLLFFENFLVNKEINKFTSYVHALKSALATLGEKDVSAKAAALESAGKNNDITFIQSNIQVFTEQLKEIIINISAALTNAETDEQKAKIDSGNTTRMDPDLIRLFNEFIEAVNSKNALEIDQLLEEINKKSLNSEIKNEVDKILYEILIMEYDTALQIAKKLVNNR